MIGTRTTHRFSLCILVGSTHHYLGHLVGFSLGNPMKSLAAFLLLAGTLGVFAQEVVETGPHHRVVRTVVELPDNQGTVTNAIVELAGGMHYWDGRGWQTSDPQFENLPGGATARKAPYGLILAPNLMDDGAVDFVAADGKRFRSNPAFLAYRNITTGEGVMISTVKASAGNLTGPKEVLYEDAFTDVVGTVRFRLMAEGIEQDVLLFGPFPSPAELGLEAGNDPVQMEMWTHFSEWGPLGSSPQN